MVVKTNSTNKNLYKTQNINAVKVQKEKGIRQKKVKTYPVQLTPTAPKEMQKVLNSMTKMVMEQFNGQKIRERNKSFKPHPLETAFHAQTKSMPSIKNRKLT